MSFTAGKLRVLIATTNGPVEVQLLTEEDAAIGRCVACIAGTTEVADIASAYHAFVVRPTGVIEGRFGHSCYRLDVSGRIDAGSSWQLGVFAAHALLFAGRLAQENDVADGVLWITGSVRPVDLTVGAVSHVPEKLENSSGRLTQELKAGRPVLLAVPSANEADAQSPLTSDLLAQGAELVFPAHAQALFDRLGIQLPGAPAKRSTLSLTVLAPPSPEAMPVTSGRRVAGWAVATALIGLIAAGAFIYSRSGLTVAPTPQATASATPEPARISTASPPPTVRPELVPETIPFLKTSDKQRIRDEYLPASNYKALAMNMFESHFVSGMSSQELADKAAIDNCENNKRRPPTDSTLAEAEYRCDLFASGPSVVARRKGIPMPPMPWVNASVQRPFVVAELPMASQDAKEAAERRFHRYPRSKALVVSPSGRVFTTSADSSPDEAMRRTLERCGYISNVACLVVAVDDMFVTAVPTSATPVGFYNKDSLFGVQDEERADIARRLATSRDGWHAVALGVTGHAGTKVGAISESAAVNGALENCALYDHDCHIAVIGPFLVQARQATAPKP